MKYANKYLFSDVEPYSVVRRVSDKTLEIQRMKFERDPSWVPDVDLGGFLGHVKNNDKQKWIISEDASAPVIRIRLRKDGIWRDKFDNKFYLSDKPVRRYDYNF